MSTRKILKALCISVVLVSFVLAAGCGGESKTYTQQDLAGRRYLLSDESVDSRTVELKPDGTFEYDITTASETWSITGNYAVEGDTLTLNFGESQRVSELSGKTQEFSITGEGKSLTDLDGYLWITF